MKFLIDYTNLALLAIAALSGALLARPALTRRAQALSVQQAIQLINRRNATIIDLRAIDAYKRGHLPQARQLAFDELPAKIAQAVKNKRHPILLVCQTGQHARQAEASLKQMGYTEVFYLQGGLSAWQQAGMPIIR